MSNAECAATGSAFLALSWERSALRHHRWAWDEHQRGLPRATARWLGQCVRDLDEALTGWGRVLVWLERAANEERADAETVDAIRVLFARSVEQQHRLAQLGRVIQHELVHGTPSVPVCLAPHQQPPPQEVQS